MKAYINAFSTGHTKSADFAVLIDDGQNEKTYSYSIDEATMNAAEIEAAIFVFDGINDKNTPLELYTSSKYLTSMLERHDNNWVKAAVFNKERINLLREKMQSFKDIQIIIDKDSDKMTKVKELSRR